MCRPNYINCFNCESWFYKENSKECQICGEFKCPNCSACLCDMSNDVKKAILAMIRTYERYLSHNFDLEPYDFSKHNKI